jgi:hypothetical protein
MFIYQRVTDVNNKAIIAVKSQRRVEVDLLQPSAVAAGGGNLLVVVDWRKTAWRG